ncbi:SDR family NAD(P)-dependent oxidoreductase [Novosphingobium sp. KN65.2]|uniref:SDR family NAD(P)-dependent oxidoreductase n=1 Tax=Novosphingobium sp. KN65.2 TaxID=1478134 RepID=UPI0005DCFAE2|nr:SDR family oxidoreductase [Novosphingobium sp. KN65.2]CDO34785.1 Oxidoreductase [Novosphingobium sp. KN65.2]
MPRFEGKTALITGAASGIGAASARHLCTRGLSRLILIDKDEQALAAFSADCETVRHHGDVANPALWTKVTAGLDRLDCAILNAGRADSAPIVDLDLANWRQVLSTNLDGMFLSLQCAMRAMQDAGGSIVLTASVSGIKAEPGTAAYGASKAGVIQLAKVAAKEGASKGIRVNAMAPGGVDTPIWDQVAMFDDFVEQHGSREAAIAAMGELATPLGRFARSDEIAGQIAFLLSDAAATITGTVLVSDGGYSL